MLWLTSLGVHPHILTSGSALCQSILDILCYTRGQAGTILIVKQTKVNIWVSKILIKNELQGLENIAQRFN